jgi:hypothetical protein
MKEFQMNLNNRDIAYHVLSNYVTNLSLDDLQYHEWSQTFPAWTSPSGPTNVNKPTEHMLAAWYSDKHAAVFDSQGMFFRSTSNFEIGKNGKVRWNG